MKKVVNLVFNDFTNDNRVLKMSRSLQNNGYEVTVLATNFKKNLPREEKIEGFTVKRINVGGFRFLPLNLFLFWLAIIKNSRNANIIHANDLYALPPAYVIKKFFNRDVKIVYDCHEHETEGDIYIGKPIISFFAKLFERKMIYDADAVLTVSKSIAEDYVKIYNIEEPILVLNSPLIEGVEKKNLFREELNIPDDKEIFLFQGKNLPGRGLDDLIEVFKRLEDINKDIVLVLLVYGEGLEEIKESIKGSKNIYWHEKVSVLEYMDYVSSADWGIYLMENICKNHDYALPNKVFDYLMAGLPIVISDLKEVSRVVQENRIGYTVNAKNREKVVNLLKDFDKDTKKQFLTDIKEASKKFSWEEQEKVLLKIYDSL